MSNIAMFLILADRLTFFAVFFLAVEWYGLISPLPLLGLFVANVLNWVAYSVFDPTLSQLAVISIFTILANVSWIVITAGTL